jgi:hypothetical protein
VVIASDLATQIWAALIGIMVISTIIAWIAYIKGSKDD